MPQFGFKVSDQGHFSGSSITYRCEPGYTLHGASVLKCMTGERRAWDNPLPSCIGTFSVIPPQMFLYLQTHKTQALFATLTNVLQQHCKGRKGSFFPEPSSSNYSSY